MTKIRMLSAFLCLAKIFLGVGLVYGLPGTPQSFSPVVKKVLPAVVNISSTKSVSSSIRNLTPGGQGDQLEEMFNFFLGPKFSDGLPDVAALPKVQSLGSGFIISKDGYIVTNSHVVIDAEDVIVKMNDGQEYKAKLVGRDPRTDVAVIKIESKKALPFVEFADSKKIEVGDWILTIGNPFGLGGTVAAGIVSSRSRDISSKADDVEVVKYVDDLIQTDASINIGNSGGPMIDMEGKVVGVNFAMLAPGGNTVGIGFAVPSALVKNVVEALRKKGHASYGWLGVNVQDVSEEIALSVGLPGKKGAMVVSVIDGGPAKKAGLKEGDVILEIGKQELESVDKLPRLVGEMPIGQKTKIVLWREGRRQSLTLVIEELPTSAVPGISKNKGEQDKAEGKQDILGISFVEVDSKVRAAFRLPSSVSGLLVQSVKPKSLASYAGIRPGDIILEVGGEPVLKLETMRRFVDKAEKAGKKAVLTKVYRKGVKAFKGIGLQKKVSMK